MDREHSQPVQYLINTLASLAVSGPTLHDGIERGLALPSLAVFDLQSNRVVGELRDQRGSVTERISQWRADIGKCSIVLMMVVISMVLFMMFSMMFSMFSVMFSMMFSVMMIIILIEWECIQQ